jgi:hypothetical protein
MMQIMSPQAFYSLFSIVRKSVERLNIGNDP